MNDGITPTATTEEAQAIGTAIGVFACHASSESAGSKPATRPAAGSPCSELMRDEGAGVDVSIDACRAGTLCIIRARATTGSRVADCPCAR